MKMRKLIRADVLRDLHADVKRGVPVATAMRKYLPKDSMTRPTVVKLLQANTEVDSCLSELAYAKADQITGSLFPTWLDSQGAAVQEQPYDYSYEGIFPLGRWACAI